MILKFLSMTNRTIPGDLTDIVEKYRSLYLLKLLSDVCERIKPLGDPIVADIIEKVEPLIERSKSHLKRLPY